MGGELTVDHLRRLGYAVPELKAPRYHYRHAVVWRGVAHLSGKLPVDATGATPYVGRVGAEVCASDAVAAATLCALQLVAALDDEVGLVNVEQILHVRGYVATAPGFTDPGQVVDGASRLLTEIFGDRGMHARTAVGVLQLPDDVPVEIEASAAVAPAG